MSNAPFVSAGTNAFCDSKTTYLPSPLIDGR